MNDALACRLLEQAQIVFECRREPALTRLQDIDCPYSVVSRVEIECDGAAKVVYLKRVKEEGIGNDAATNRVMVEYRILNQMFHRFLGHPNYGVARPLAVFPEEFAILTEEVPGTKLADVIGTSGKRYMLGVRKGLLGKYCALAGAWLREFQSLTAQGTGHFNLQGLMQYCDERIDTLIANSRSGIDRGFKARFASYLEAKCEQLAGRTDRIVGRHNDFAPHNLIVNGERLSVIDFGFFDHDSSLYDVCRFWFHLEGMKASPLFAASTVERMQKSFFEGYGTSIDPHDPAFEMIASRYFLTRLATMIKEGVRGGLRGWVDRRSYRWCLRWLTERCK